MENDIRFFPPNQNEFTIRHEYPNFQTNSERYSFNATKSFTSFGLRMIIRYIYHFKGPYFLYTRNTCIESETFSYGRLCLQLCAQDFEKEQKK